MGLRAAEIFVGNTEVISIIEHTQTLIDDHFEFTSGRHSRYYLHKDVFLAQTRYASVIVSLLSRLCLSPTDSFDKVEGFIGPYRWGAEMARLVAHNLAETHGRSFFVFAAEKHGDDFFIRPSQVDLIAGKRLIAVEEILTTGGSAKKVVELVERFGCEILGLVSMANRHCKIPATLEDLPFVRWLISGELEDWEPRDCPLCKAGVPLNTRLGHGKLLPDYCHYQPALNF